MRLKIERKKTDFYSWRMTFIKIGFFVVVCVLLWRLYNLQIVQGDYYAALSLKQRSSQNTTAERGNIYFQNKDGELIPAAINKNGFLLAINPSLIKDENLVYDKLSKIVKIDKDDFLKKSSKKNDPFEILAHRLDKETALEIKVFQKEFEGIILEPEKWRFYPANNLLSHTLGFVGYDEYKLKGRYGLEKFYDSYLTGSASVGKQSFFANLLDLGQKVFANYENAGASLVLTVEPILQGVLESNLEKTWKQYNAPSAGGLIINPQNGKILALAAKPDFNPNEYWRVKDMSLFINPLVENVFEMGSVFKPLTLAAAIDQNAITPETTYVDKGYVIFNNKRIENYDGKGRGQIDMQTVLNKSLNTGAVFAMQALGKEKYNSYIINYGFGDLTGIDLPGEVKGKIDNLSSMRDVEFATASFGQGIAVSPIELSVALSALANGGNIIKPHLVDKIIHKKAENGKEEIIKIAPEVKRKVIKNETSETISRMLVTVVDNALLAGTVKMDNYSIAAKTGTAQLIKKDGRGYSENEYLHTFFGYAPAFDPQFLIFLFLERPVGARYAAQTLTPPFMDIVKFIFNYYEVPPDR